MLLSSSKNGTSTICATPVRQKTLMVRAVLGSPAKEMVVNAYALPALYESLEVCESRIRAKRTNPDTVVLVAADVSNSLIQ